MDDVLFGVKRAHLAMNWWALRKLKEFGITPARFDLMRMIFTRNHRWAQSELRRALGVARATLSRMVRALVKLGWIVREVNAFDRRTLDCVLTEEGRRVVATVMTTLIWPRVVARAVDAAFESANVADERSAVEFLARRIVIAFAIWRGVAIVTL